MPTEQFESRKRPTLIDFVVAADLLGVSESTMLRWLREGEFPGVRVRTRWHVSKTDIANELGMTRDEIEETLDML